MPSPRFPTQAEPTSQRNGVPMRAGRTVSTTPRTTTDLRRAPCHGDDVSDSFSSGPRRTHCSSPEIGRMLLGLPCPAWRRRPMTSLLESLAEPFRPQQESPPRLRASDADREVVVQALLDAIARGLLTLQEGDERVAAAYTARFQDELPRLTADLPPTPSSAPVAPGWRTLALLA